MSFMPAVSHEGLCVILVGHLPRRITITGVSFLTRMNDGHLIVTDNEGFGTATWPANHDVVTFGRVTDVAELYAVHQRRKSRALSGRTVVPVGWRAPANASTRVLSASC